MRFCNLKIKLFIEEIHFSLSSTKITQKNPKKTKTENTQTNQTPSSSAAYFYLHSCLLQCLSNENTQLEGVDLKLSEVNGLTVY